MATDPVLPTEALGVSEHDWPKRLRHRTLRRQLREGSVELLYEDDLVVAFRHTEDDYGAEPGTWETRVVIAPKRHVPTLLDLGVADGALTLALLNGVQQVALKLGLQHEGFEVRVDVLPPYQETDYLRLKVRAGRRPT